MKPGWPRPGRMPRLAPLVAVCFAVVGLTLPNPSSAVPTLLGGQFYYTGGDVVIEVLHQDSAYDEVLQLRSALSCFDAAIGSQVGSRVTITASQLADMGIGVGDELQFGIRVVDTGHAFALGQGERNADGLAHAYVRGSRDNVHYYVGFEDFYGGGDRDYNDTIFRLSGGLAADLAEPSSLLLLVPGIGLLALKRRNG